VCALHNKVAWAEPGPGWPYEGNLSSGSARWPEHWRAAWVKLPRLVECVHVGQTPNAYAIDADDPIRLLHGH
jgi:hypothetical protein